MVERLFLSVTTQFAGRVALPDHDGICRNAHGYRYKLEVIVAGTVSSERPWLNDVAELEATIAQFVTGPLDGSNLADVVGYPSMEGIVLWVVAALRPRVPGLAEVVLTAPPAYCVRWRAESP